MIVRVAAPLDRLIGTTLPIWGSAYGHDTVPYCTVIPYPVYLWAGIHFNHMSCVWSTSNPMYAASKVSVKGNWVVGV
jgi:hypothetical protein